MVVRVGELGGSAYDSLVKACVGVIGKRELSKRQGVRGSIKDNSDKLILI